MFPIFPLGISPKTNQHIFPSYVIKLLNFEKNSTQHFFLYCSIRASKPKLVIEVKPKLSIMIRFAILFTFQATQRLKPQT